LFSQKKKAIERAGLSSEPCIVGAGLVPTSGLLQRESGTGALPEHRGGVPSTGAHVSALGPCLGFLWLSLKKNMAGALRNARFKNA